MNREWTDEEIEILRRDRAARIPVPVTAAKLNRPVPATYLRARMIGTQVQKHQPWSEEETLRLRALVMANPPMTDKRIAEELGRTVTQVRWKMQDLSLIGVRDLSKLAKITAATAPTKQASPESAAATWSDHSSAKSGQSVPSPNKLEPHKVRQPQLISENMVALAVARLEAELEHIFKSTRSASEKGLLQAAMAAIAEKKAIDERLAALRLPKEGSAKGAQKECEQGAGNRVHAVQKPAVQGPRTSEKKAPRLRGSDTLAVQKTGGGSPKIRAGQLAARPLAKPAPAPPPSPPPAPAPRIVVLEAPASPRSDHIPPEVAQTSGRGGWKSVRRDPARIAARARAKPASRADAMDLAQAAQAAIEQFIAQRGVTRSEVSGTQVLVTRLQARGYIVVGDGDGWIIDQRHHVINDEELRTFAAARGVSLDAAA